MTPGRLELPWQSQFLRFLIVGVANTAVGLGSIWALIGLAGWADLPANAGGYALGLVCSFVLNRRWTFAHSGAWWPALWRFSVVFAIAYAANLATLFALRDGLNVDRYLAHALATVPYTLLFFIGSRLFAFRTTTPAAA
jgi:putative flippase GtrA